jgi:glycosylphosphatidylinositol transamidase (GPIT) subunit GPI8
VQPLGIFLFCDFTSLKQFKIVSKKGMWAERVVDIEKFEEFNLEEILKIVGLLDSVVNVEVYNDTLIREFYSNMKSSICDKQSQFYHFVYVCSFSVEFNLEMVAYTYAVPYYIDVDGLGDEV